MCSGCLLRTRNVDCGNLAVVDVELCLHQLAQWAIVNQNIFSEGLVLPLDGVRHNLPQAVFPFALHAGTPVGLGHFSLRIPEPNPFLRRECRESPGGRGQFFRSSHAILSAADKHGHNLPGQIVLPAEVNVSFLLRNRVASDSADLRSRTVFLDQCLFGGKRRLDKAKLAQTRWPFVRLLLRLAGLTRRTSQANRKRRQYYSALHLVSALNFFPVETSRHMIAVGGAGSSGRPALARGKTIITSAKTANAITLLMRWSPIPKSYKTAFACGSCASLRAMTPATAIPHRASPAINPDAVRIPALSTRAFCASLRFRRLRSESVIHRMMPPTKIAKVVPSGRYMPTENNITLLTSIMIMAMPNATPTTTSGHAMSPPTIPFASIAMSPAWGAGNSAVPK